MIYYEKGGNEMNMIDAQGVLKLFDIETGYGTDHYSKKVLQSLDKNDERKHVTIRKYMKRYIDSYIERKFREENNRLPMTDKERDSIIKIEGATKATKYEEKGIRQMLEDKRIKELLRDELEKNTVLLEGRRVPKVVMDYYFAETNGIIEEIEQEEYHEEIKDDSTEKLKIKLSIIQQEIENREAFEKMIEEYDEVAGSRSPESLYYYEIE